MKVLLGVTGSVAAVVTLKLVENLTSAGNEVQVVLTESSRHFFNFQNLGVMYWFDKDEWQKGFEVHKSRVLHIDLREWADILLIAPLSANTLAKISNGLADNLLTCIVRAWDPAKPIVVAPAMNTLMWDHPVTAEQLNKFASWFLFLKIIPPVKKILACGEEGIGAMASIETIVESVMTVSLRRDP